jgi:hypothetical protein
MPFWYSPDDESAFYSVPSVVHLSDFMKRRRYFWWGVCISCGIVLCISVYYFVAFAMSFNGKCGIGWPGLSSPVECSFGEYAAFILNLTIFTIAVMAISFWPILLAILVLPPLIGYLLDRREQVSV